MSLYATTRTMTLVMRGVNRLSPVVKEAAADIGLLEKAQKRVSDASYRLLFAGVAISAFSFIAVRGLMRVVAASEAGVFVAKDYENVLKRLADIMGRHLAPFAAFLVRQLHALSEVFEKYPLVARWVAGLGILAIILGLLAIPLILIIVALKFFVGIIVGAVKGVKGLWLAITALTGISGILLGIFVILAVAMLGVAILALMLYHNIFDLKEGFVDWLVAMGVSREEAEKLRDKLVDLGGKLQKIIDYVADLIGWLLENEDAWRSVGNAIVWVINKLVDLWNGILWAIDIFRRFGDKVQSDLGKVRDAIQWVIDKVYELITALLGIPQNIVTRVTRIITTRRTGDGDGDGDDGDGDGDGDGGGGIEGAPSQTIAEVMADWEAGRVEPGTYGAYGLQHGFEGWVRKPTRFIAGEREDEYLSVTPRGKMTPSSMTIPIRIDNLNTKADKDELGTLISRAVANELLKLRSTRGLA